MRKAKLKHFALKKANFYNDFCYGFVAVKSGELKVFATHENKEIVLFNLKSGDECLICADCLSAFGENFRIEVVKDAVLKTLPSDVFKVLKEKYPLFSNHILGLLASRFASSVEMMSSALFAPLKTRIPAPKLTKRRLCLHSRTNRC